MTLTSPPHVNDTMPQLGRLLVVDDEVQLMTALCEMLTRQGYAVDGFVSGSEALEALREREYDLLLTDLMMPDMDGIELLRAAQKIDPYLVGLIMTGQGTVQTAVEAMKTGAFDYLLKPFKLGTILPIVSRALGVRRLRMENVELRGSVAIYELSQAIAFTLDLNTILNKTADAALQQCEADEVSIMLPTQAGDELYIAVVRGERREHILGRRTSLDQSIAGWVARNREPLSLQGEVHDPRFASLYPRPDIHAAISLPMMTGNRLVGVLNVNTTRHRRLTLGQAKALTILISAAASGLENARLYQAIQQELVRRRQVEEDLRAAEAKYRSLVEQLPAIIYVLELGDMNQVTYISPQVEPLLGFSPPELLADPDIWTEQLHPDDREHVLTWIRQTITLRQSSNLEYRMVARDGRVVWFRNQIMLALDAAGQPHSANGLMLDITERKRVEAALNQQTAELAALYRASAPLLSPGNDLTQLAEEITQAVTREFDLADCEVLWADEAKHRLKRLAHAGQYRVTAIADLPLDGPGLIIAAYHTRETIYSPDTSADPRYLPGVSKTRSELVIPLLVGGQVVGLLDLQSPEVDAFDERARRVVAAYAERAALALENARLLEETRHRAEDLQAIATLSMALRVALTRDKMLSAILDQLTTLLRADAAAVIIQSPATRETLVKLTHGVWSGRPDLGLESLGPTVTTLSEGQPYLHNDAHNDPTLAQLGVFDDIRAVACIPLIARDQAIGVLWMGRKTPITDSELHMLVSMADISANAIQRESLHEQTEQRLQRLAALRVIDVAISSSMDTRVILNVLLDQVTTQLGVDAAAVLLLNSHFQVLEYTAGRGFRAKGVERSRLRLGEGLAGRAALERRTLGVLNLLEEEPDLARAPLLAGEGFRAYYVSPLIAKGQVEGVLEVFDRTALTPDADWLAFLESLAGQAAIAIENSQLFDGLQRSNLQLSLAYDATIEGWSRALDLRDKETEGHSQRVTDLTLRLARMMGIGEADLLHIRRGALLHDIGKMGIPDSILLKPGQLTADEWALMRKHPDYAYELLSPVLYLRPALDIPYCHHEKWDGTGYPRGLKEDQIPLAARLFAVVDVWDALSSDRPYRPGWPAEKVREHIRANRGTHFEPQVVDVFLKVLSEG